MCLAYVLYLVHNHNNVEQIDCLINACPAKLGGLITVYNEYFSKLKIMTNWSTMNNQMYGFSDKK